MQSNKYKTFFVYILPTESIKIKVRKIEFVREKLANHFVQSLFIYLFIYSLFNVDVIYLQ